MKNLSYFLEDKKVQEEISSRMRQLAEATGGRVALIDGSGKIILEQSSLLGLSSLVGLDKKIEEKLEAEWQEVAQSAIERKQPFFIEDNYGLIIFEVPIMNGQRNWGVLVGHGGFFDEGQGEERQREKREELYHLLELGRLGVTGEDYFEATQKMNFIKMRQLEKMAYYPVALIGILANRNGKNVGKDKQ